MKVKEELTAHEEPGTMPDKKGGAGRREIINKECRDGTGG